MTFPCQASFDFGNPDRSGSGSSGNRFVGLSHIAGKEIRYDLVVVTSTVPSVRAVITLLTDLEHSRWPNRAPYMPHVVVGDPGPRKGRISGNTLTEHYLGVLVADAPDEIPPGGTAEITLRLMYWPGEKYEQLIRGATFTVREGPKIVGFGQVLAANA